MAGQGVKRGEQKQNSAIDDLVQFQKDAQNFFNKCTRPDRAEYTKILQASFMGIVVMGFIGYIIKLVFIPINNIILSNWAGVKEIKYLS